MCKFVESGHLPAWDRLWGRVVCANPCLLWIVNKFLTDNHFNKQMVDPATDAFKNIDSWKPDGIELENLKKKKKKNTSLRPTKTECQTLKNWSIWEVEHWIVSWSLALWTHVENSYFPCSWTLAHNWRATRIQTACNYSVIGSEAAIRFTAQCMF